LIKLVWTKALEPREGGGEIGLSEEFAFLVKLSVL